MLFFSFVIAPTVHKFLPTQQSGPYIRKLFPIYYIINAGLALGSVIAIASLGVFNAIFYANVIILVLFALCYFYLMLAINKQKTKNNSKFKILHRSSVAINLIQIILLISITVILLDF
ncbi:MAG: DUF4149 domain-containing protein [Actinobacteria bacterium]|uniref:DUF4149 domain-containing protein n=1 Tax=Candidatus Fonsibacter lacus TaxID=2576439 RepID=A0A965GFG5_9PROT|nr:DUF4149 domain-containing protein [Candidatus Fonsibacter lacus]